MALADLESWFKKHLPEVIDDLRPPATADELAEFADAIGADLPPEVMALYRWHNGQKNDATGLFYGLGFLSLDEAASEWQSWDAILSDDDDEIERLNGSSTTAAPGIVKPLYGSRGWIPFAQDFSGNFLAIDLDPDDNGTRGQIINCGPDEDLKCLVADDMSAFIEWMVKALNAGKYTITDDGDGERSLNTKQPDSEHFLDAVKELFGDS